LLSASLAFLANPDTENKHLPLTQNGMSGGTSLAAGLLAQIPLPGFSLPAYWTGYII
jgi:hypothetical protein